MGREKSMTSSFTFAASAAAFALSISRFPVYIARHSVSHDELFKSQASALHNDSSPFYGKRTARLQCDLCSTTILAHSWSSGHTLMNSCLHLKNIQLKQWLVRFHAMNPFSKCTLFHYKSYVGVKASISKLYFLITRIAW